LSPNFAISLNTLMLVSTVRVILFPEDVH